GGNYVYTLKPDMGNKPVNFTSFYDTLRFANWMHNGQPTGGQNNLTTEDGAYTLTNSGTPSNTPTNFLTITRKPGAQVFLPSENEWYKAAYYDPVSVGADADG